MPDPGSARADAQTSGPAALKRALIARVRCIGVRPLLLLTLDLLIVGYGLVLALILATGGFTLGPLSAHSVAKPLLVLILLLPIRAAVTGASWIGRRARQAWDPVVEGVRWLFEAVPASVRDVVFAVAVTRLAGIGIAFMANLLVPPRRLRAFAMPFRRQRLAETFAAWDSGWYFDIAKRGYFYDPEHQSSIAFFPLYPLTVRMVGKLFGGSDQAIWLAGILVSWTAFLVALVVLHRFAERLFDREAARRTVLYLAIFPFSLFFTRVYAESLFLLWTVLAVVAAHDGRWWRAGLFGGLGALTRPNGILIGVPLTLYALRGEFSRETLRRLLPLAALPLAVAAYSAFVYSMSGNPLAWLSAQSLWGYSLGHPPWEQLLRMLGRLERYGLYDYFFVSRMAPFRLIHGVTALLFLTLTPAVFRRLGAPLGTYVLISLLVPLSGNALEGIGRYAATLFPVFILIGRLRSPLAHEAILIVGCLFAALLLILFVTLHPIY